MGVKLAIDDFETGHSSLSYLRHLPVDLVKIDGSFVVGLGLSPEDEALVSAVVGIAHVLGLRAVAEGAATDEQLVRLRESGCDMVQGYRFAESLPSEDVPALLAAGRRR